MGIKTYTRHSYVIEDGDDEFEVEYNPCEWIDPIIERTGDRTVVGYLVRDETCDNPLEDSVGMGKVLERGLHGQWGVDSEIQEALALNSEWEPDLDLVFSGLEQAWQSYVGGLSDEMGLQLVNTLWPDDLPEDFEEEDRPTLFNTLVRGRLMKEDPDPEFSMSEHLAAALYYSVDYKLIDAAADLLDFDFRAVATNLWREAVKAQSIGNPFAVLLDKYEHSGVHWSVSGTGYQCRWDTSREAGVWLPDEFARMEIERRAPVYDYAVIRTTNWILGTGKRYSLTMGGGEPDAESDDFTMLWGLAVEFATKERERGRKPYFNGFDEACVQLAKEALDQYNAWLAGDCYGVCVEVFDSEGEQLSDDACWGYVGSEWAQEALRDEVQGTVQFLVTNKTI